jgi:hypothetical protein
VEKPNRNLLKITGDGLIAAAENLKKVMPDVLDISKMIVAAIIGLA